MALENQFKENQEKKKLPFFLRQSFIFLLIILISFGLGFGFGKFQVVCPVCPPEEVDFSLFWQTWKTIEERYVDKEKINVQEMIYGAIEGMLKTLEDPYTIFLSPDDSKRFIEDIKGSFEGVGMEIDIKEGQLQVIAPLEGTPAQKAGMRPGDKIIKVDGKSTAEITIDTAINWIRGPKGTEVILTIYREDEKETKEIKVIRDVIDIPSLKLELREDKIAYLRLYHFSEKSAYDFREAAIKILNSETERIILDLRNNPGGYLEIAQEIAGWFLQKGEVITIEDFSREEKQKEYLAKGNAKLAGYPIVILINKGSASGSEILAGAIRDNRGVKLIGETSFGKGSVQELVKLRDDSFLKITIAKWLTPKGELITDKGLEPDIIVEMTMEDYEQEKDPQLDKAIEVIKEMR